MRLRFSLWGWRARAGGCRSHSSSAILRHREPRHRRRASAEAYAALGDVGAWWSGAHSYSGDAANMRIELWAGGCFCETLPDGGTVEHMRVIQALPGRVLRMSGGLGPLQEEAVAGTLTWTLRAVPGGTEIVSRYLVSGHVRGDTGAYAAPVDAVLREQFERLRIHLAR